MPAGSNINHDDERRWRITGHDFIGRPVTLRSAELPAQGLDEESDGCQGVVTKWVPESVDAEERRSPPLFFVHVSEGPAGHQLCNGIELEEYEVLIAAARCGTRSRKARLE